MLVIFVFSYFIQALLLLKKSYVFYIFRVIIIFLIGIQAVWIIQERNEKSKHINIEGSGHVSNYIPHTMIYNNDTLFNVLYVRDSCRRRISEIQTISDINDIIGDKKHAIFLGCSFTMGYGLDYSSTFPFMFEQLKPEYKSYNYGIGGYGPHHTALLFDDGIDVINKSTIKEPHGFALYTFIKDHLRRVYGSSSFLVTALPLIENKEKCILKKSFYIDVYVENDSLVVRKISLWHKITVNVLNNVALFRYLNITLPYPKTEKFYQRFADIVNHMAKKYWEINPEGDFYIGIYPEKWEKDLAWTSYLNPKIKVLEPDIPPDYYERFDEYVIKPDVDWHPTKLSNIYYINEIIRLISSP